MHQQIVAWTKKKDNDCTEMNKNQPFSLRPNMNKPSYLTEAWLPEAEELLDDKGVGLSVNDRFGFDDGKGSVCVWYC